MATSLEKFTTSFNENLLNSILIPLATYFQEQEIDVELKDLKGLFDLPVTAACIHKPIRGKNPKPCGKDTLPGDEYCKTHLSKSKKEEIKPPLLSRLPKSLVKKEETTPSLSSKKVSVLDLKNLPALKLKNEE